MIFISDDRDGVETLCMTVCGRERRLRENRSTVLRRYASRSGRADAKRATAECAEDELASTGGADVSRRRQWLTVAAVLSVYAVGFFAFYPGVLTVSDEARYVRQAVAFANGSVDVLRPDATGALVREQPSSYPPGTSLLMAPFVLAFGHQGAFLVSLLALVLTVVFTGLWLEATGKPPWFSLLVLTYPPALILGRVAMSDVPSAALMAGTLLGFYRGVLAVAPGQRTSLWLAAGLLAGASSLLRESNPLIALPFFAGAVLRRDAGAWALVTGGAAGLGLRALAAWLVFGDPFHHKPPGAGFSAEILLQQLPLYVAAALVLVPGGLACALAYRGPRRPELIWACTLFLGFYASFGYSGSTYTGAASGPWKGSVLTLRFLLPLVPLLAFAVGSVLAPKLHGHGLDRRAGLMRGYAALTALAALATHAGMERWSASQRSIRDAIYARTEPGAILATNRSATDKFIHELYGERVVIDLAVLASEARAPWLDPNRPLYIVLLERDDSELWRGRTARDRLQLQAIASRHHVDRIFDARLGNTDRLRIWKLARE